MKSLRSLRLLKGLSRILSSVSFKEEVRQIQVGLLTTPALRLKLKLNKTLDWETRKWFDCSRLRRGFSHSEEGTPRWVSMSSHSLSSSLGIRCSLLHFSIRMNRIWPTKWSILSQHYSMIQTLRITTRRNSRSCREGKTGQTVKRRWT